MLSFWLGGTRRQRAKQYHLASPAAFVSPDDPPASTLAPDYRLIGEHEHGTHRERFVAPVDQLADIGDTKADVGAAAGLTALTAYGMMLKKAQLRPGQSGRLAS